MDIMFKLSFSMQLGGDFTESIFTILLLILVLLFYISNRNNMINKWCAITGFTFWLGVVKESFMFNIVPFLQNTWGQTIPYEYYKGAYSSMTWMLYSFAMPSAVIASLYFYNLDSNYPKLMSRLKVLLYLPALLLSIFFPPLAFRTYQLGSIPFWITYSIYNGILVITFTFFIINGILIEKPGKAKTQKKLVMLIIWPPVLYWYITVFPTHTLQLGNLLKVWQGNVFVLLVCIIAFIIMAFKDGVMGLHLTSESYRWNSDLSIINKGAEYTSHMLKNQTVKMEWCIDNLKAQFDQSDGKTPEELEILSRSIYTLKSYMEKMKKQTESINLVEVPCNLKALLDSSAAMFHNVVSIQINIQDDIFLMCDKTHMTEVFVNIISNAVEAMHDSGTITICCGYGRGGRFYRIIITDDGIGMGSNDLKNMFTPYFTTKNTEKNFGLGLAYCKNAVEKHNGQIHAESEPGKGTDITIELPAKRIIVNERGGQNG